MPLYCELEDILKNATQKNEPPFILILDGLEDPRNFGAIARTAEAAGVHGIVIPKNRSVQVNETVVKTSTGAINLLPVARVTNTTETIKKLKKEFIWIVGLEADGSSDFKEIDYKTPTALVIGSEGFGLSRLVRENCDFIASIPMRGKISSLNASVAAALLMYEVVRQRG